MSQWHIPLFNNCTCEIHVGTYSTYLQLYIYFHRNYWIISFEVANEMKRKRKKNWNEIGIYSWILMMMIIIIIKELKHLIAQCCRHGCMLYISRSPANAIHTSAAHEKNTSERNILESISCYGQKEAFPKMSTLLFSHKLLNAIAKRSTLKNNTPNSDNGRVYSLPPFRSLSFLFRSLTLPVPYTILNQNQNQIKCLTVNATNRHTSSSYFAWFWSQFLWIFFPEYRMNLCNNNNVAVPHIQIQVSYFLFLCRWRWFYQISN